MERTKAIKKTQISNHNPTQGWTDINITTNMSVCVQ